MYRWFLLFAAFVSSAMGADIRVVGPTQPIKPNKQVKIIVQGLELSELRSASVTISPTDGVEMSTEVGWDLVPYIRFQSENNGVYHLSVTTNNWREDLDTALSKMRGAIIDPAMFKEFETTANRIVAQYPVRTGTCVLEVAGTPIPPPNPDPPPGPTPPPVTQGKRIIVIVRETETDNDRTNSLMIRLRQGKVEEYLDQKGHLLDVLDQHLISDRWKQALSSKKDSKGNTVAVKLPAMIIADAQSFAVLSVETIDPAHMSPEVFLDYLKSFGG